jgi:hypothetical protein
VGFARNSYIYAFSFSFYIYVRIPSSPAPVDELTTSLQIIPPFRWGGLGAAGLEYVGGQLGSGVAPRSWHCSGTQGSLSIQVAEDPHPLGTDVVHRIAGIYGWPSWSQSAGSNAEEHVKGIPTAHVGREWLEQVNFLFGHGFLRASGGPTEPQPPGASLNTTLLCSRYTCRATMQRLDQLDTRIQQKISESKGWYSLRCTARSIRAERDLDRQCDDHPGGDGLIKIAGPLECSLNACALDGTATTAEDELMLHGCGTVGRTESSLHC